MIKTKSTNKKHGVSFQEAETVFDDENAIYDDDDEHSIDERRFVIVGKSDIPNLLMVCYCERENTEVIRIFSARKASKFEKIGILLTEVHYESQL